MVWHLALSPHSMEVLGSFPEWGLWMFSKCLRGFSPVGSGFSHKNFCPRIDIQIKLVLLAKCTDEDLEIRAPYGGWPLLLRRGGVKKVESDFLNFIETFFFLIAL